MKKKFAEPTDAQRKAMLKLMIKVGLDALAGKAITKRWQFAFSQFLKWQLPSFFETDEGKAIKESAERAERELFGKIYTGKCTDIYTEEDVWIHLAARNPEKIAGAVAVSFLNPRWNKLLTERGDNMIARAIEKGKKENPNLTADESMVFFWARQSADFEPPICFWSDQAGADRMTQILQDANGNDEIITAEAYRIWRRRWRLKKSSLTLIKKFEVRDGGIFLG
jgi:hypothetical protein